MAQDIRLLPSLAEAERIRLALFRRQYMQRVAPSELQYPPSYLLQQWDVQKWVWSFVDAFQKDHSYPAYDRMFLKQLQLNIENAVQDADEPDIVDSFAELYSQLLPCQDVDDYVWIEYVPPWQALQISYADPGIDLLEKPNVISAAGCTGHRTWEAALTMASLLGSEPYIDHVRGKSILELGAGTGLITMTCALLGAKRVLATDGDGSAVARQEQVIVRNKSITSPVDCQQYLWGDDTQGLGMSAVDTVIAADVTYGMDSLTDLVKTLLDIAKTSPRVTIYIAATVRSVEPLEIFEQLCKKNGLRWQNVHNVRKDRDAELEQRGYFHSRSTDIKIVKMQHDGFVWPP